MFQTWRKQVGQNGGEVTNLWKKVDLKICAQSKEVVRDKPKLRPGFYH